MHHNPVVVLDALFMQSFIKRHRKKLLLFTLCLWSAGALYKTCFEQKFYTTSIYYKAHQLTLKQNLTTSMAYMNAGFKDPHFTEALLQQIPAQDPWFSLKYRLFKASYLTNTNVTIEAYPIGQGILVKLQSPLALTTSQGIFLENFLNQTLQEFHKVQKAYFHTSVELTQSEHIAEKITLEKAKLVNLEKKDLDVSFQLHHLVAKLKLIEGSLPVLDQRQFLQQTTQLATDEQQAMFQGQLALELLARVYASGKLTSTEKDHYLSQLFQCQHDFVGQQTKKQTTKAAIIAFEKTQITTASAVPYAEQLPPVLHGFSEHTTPTSYIDLQQTTPQRAWWWLMIGGVLISLLICLVLELTKKTLRFIIQDGSSIDSLRV